MKLTVHSRLQLRSPRTFNTKVAPIRRPGFLEGLEEAKYHEAFEKMGKCRRTMMTHKVFNAGLKDVGLTLAAICEHIYFWVDPTYVKPTSAEPDKLHRMDWMLLLSRKLWVVPSDSDDEGGNTKTQVDDPRKKSKNLVFELAKSINSRLDLWKKEVCIHPTHKQLFMYLL